MAQNSKGISISFPVEEREEIEKRLKELKLQGRGAMSQYFQMLREYDKVHQLRRYYHEGTGTFHFYPETVEFRNVAEEEALYDAAKQEEEKKKKS